MGRKTAFRPGDLVEVRTPDEIVETLDADGAVDHVPFMPEMLPFCGKRFRIAKRVVKTCASSKSMSTMRVFKSDDVVTLGGQRCSGIDHDGCQKSCMIFWREAWLRRVDEATKPAEVNPSDVEQLRTRLKTMTAPGIYFCQASELLRATNPMSRWERFRKCYDEIQAGNCSVPEMCRRIVVWVFWKTRKTLLGLYARGICSSKTPVEGLNLQPGEWIEVKTLDQISETLNERARNRGLFFTPDMARFCGRRQRVERRLEKIIVDGSGEMRQVRNTVFLETGLCGCSHVAFGGCTRSEFSYWREIWLRRPRVPEKSSSNDGMAPSRE
jgi:hypothetical protein